MRSEDSDLTAFAAEDSGGYVESGPISLDEVVRRAVPVRWDEAVAVIEELCSLLTADGGELSVPGLEDVTIAADGAVALRRRGRGGQGPVEAGRALHALLSTADVPMALRLFVTQATAPETYGSLREFASALAYFGKPGRPELIRALYSRATAASVVQPSVTTPRPPEAHPPKPGGEVTLKRRGEWAVKVGLAACLLVAAAWIWSSGLLTSDSATAESSNLLSQAKQAIADLGAGVRALGAAEAPAAAKEQAAPAAQRARTTRETRTSSRPDVGSLTRAVSPDTLPATPVTAAQDASVTIPAPPVQAPAPPIEPVVERDTVPRLYSTEDTDVLPPVLLYPQLPPPVMIARPGTAPPVNRMELVVSAEGTVERVRLVDGPTRMPDMMLLSGAKLWRFTPAVKDGEPVRYRAIVTWSGFP
jgi:hypothetical protein